jgi:ribulose-phosphate 3-epimerase
MALVAPSILSANFAILGADITEVIEKGADWIHVDVMDGRFVPNITIGPPVVKSIKPIVGDVPLDCHLMIVEPDKYIQDFRDAGADYITVHAEACTHLHRSVQAIHASGAKAGVALNPHTPSSVLDYVLDELDLVLVMTVNPGFGGQSLIDHCLHKISAVREEIERRGLATLIEVDGGVKVDNVKRFTEAGAQVLVSGSGIFKAEDRGAAIAALRSA